MSKLTESTFVKCMRQFPNGSDDFSFYSKVDNKFSKSWHLEFPQKKIQFNIWLDRASYLNSHESVTISCFDKNITRKGEELKNVLITDNLEILDKTVKDLFIQYS